jgi:CheY-like chemotaxis protein
VLIADDTPATRELLEGMFRYAGAEVATVENGAKALERGETEDFDLIIMDAEMPVMSGYSAMEQLRAGGVQAPIVAVTAHLHREDLQKCIAAGANQFVSKASSVDEILLIAEQYIGVLPSRELDKGDLLADSTRGREVMANAKLKYLSRFERSLAPLQEAVKRKQWARVSKILHPLSSAKMFGFTHVTEELRIISMELHRLFLSEREATAQIEHLTMLLKPLTEARAAIERELSEYREDVTPGESTPRKAT